MADAQRLCTYLRYRVGDEPERVVIWDTVEVTVGRMPTQDIVLAESDVSRLHAVFRCKRGQYSVEDCGTTLGTRVNGERVRTADLEPGDVIEIGRLRIEFQQTREALRAGGAVRFASELKGGAPAPPEDEAGDRTVLGFVPDHDLASPARSSEAPAPTGPRALSLAGALEEIPDLDGELGSGLEDLEAWRTATAVPRDLDLELGGAGSEAGDEDPNAMTRRGVQPEAPGAEAVAAPARAALGARASLALRVEVSGPLEKLQGLLAALGEDEIRVGALRFRVRPARERD